MRRAVVVVDASGAPVAGSTVELVRSPGDGPITAETRLFRRPLLQTLWLTNALLMNEAVTDGDGAWE